MGCWCAVGILGAATIADAGAAEWRRAGSAPSRSSAATQATQAEFDPFDEPATPVLQTSDDGAHSVVVRRDGSAAGFDPFDEPLNDANAAMPEAEAPGVAAEAPAPASQFDPFENDDADATGRSEDASRVQGIEEAFDEPGAQRSPRVAIAPAADGNDDDDEDAAEELPSAEELFDENATPRMPERDTPGGVAPTPFDGEDEVAAPTDEAVAPTDDLEEAFPEPGRDEESEPDDEVDPRMQQAPGRQFDYRPLDEPPGQTAEQDAERRRQLDEERLRAQENCDEIIAAVRADDIKSVSLDIRVPGEPGEDYPFECTLGQETFQPRSWPQITYMWKAAALCHKPLYFEQVQLERYGHSLPPVVQPLVSGAHFFGTLPILPYKMGLTTPNECIYTLGYYRPGSCAPYMIPAVPFTWRAAGFEAGAWTGGAFAVP